MDRRLLDEDRVMQICFVTDDLEKSAAWFADLTRYGVDVAEYTVDCQPGVARPAKYWAG